MKSFLLVALLAIAPVPKKEDMTDAAERLSLLDLAHGATVVSRTGEALLDFSALRAVDGDPGSFWLSPIHDLPQSMVIALPARSRIDRVGIRTVPGGALTANHVTFEGSLDGRTFKQLTTIKSANSGGPQWFDVPPTQASYIRVTMADSVLPDHDVRLHSVMAQGAEVEPAHAGDISGCWTINGEKARFARRGTHVVGSLETGKEPIRFEGGFDGRIYRLSWVRGNDHGMTLLTVSPDGEHLSATNWHEEAIPMFFDVSWFGEKRQCSETVPDSNDVAIALLSRNGRFSLYGGVDLGALLKMFPDARFVAHEFRFPTAQQNHDATQRACAPLAKRGHPCIAAGSDNPRQEPVTESMRALYSTTDLEIRR